MFVVSFVLNIIPGVGQILSAILALATLVPSLALGARRMHDINKSGWFMLVCLIPIVGGLIFLYFAAQPSADAPANNEQHNTFPETNKKIPTLTSRDFCL